MSFLWFEYSLICWRSQGDYRLSRGSSKKLYFIDEFVDNLNITIMFMVMIVVIHIHIYISSRIFTILFSVCYYTV